jgi:hypothetical protein
MIWWNNHKEGSLKLTVFLGLLNLIFFKYPVRLKNSKIFIGEKKPVIRTDKVPIRPNNFS